MALKISIIDDDATMRTMLEDFVKEKYKYVELSSYPIGEAALNSIAGGQDLIILDYHLDSVNTKDLNGIQIFKKIRERYASTPIIVMSGLEASEIASKSVLHGASAYIVKDENLFQRLGTEMNLIFDTTKESRENSHQKKSMIIVVLAVIGLISMFVYMKFK